MRMEHPILVLIGTDEAAEQLVLDRLGELRSTAGGAVLCYSDDVPVLLAPACAPAVRLPAGLSGGELPELRRDMPLAVFTGLTEVPPALSSALALELPVLACTRATALPGLPEADCVDASACSAAQLQTRLDEWLDAVRARTRAARYDGAYRQHYDNEATRPQNQTAAPKRRSLLDWKPRELYED